MTLEELNRGLQLEKKISDQEEILATLRAKACPSARQLDSMPHTSGISDKTGYLGIAIADMETNIERLREEQREALNEIEAFIKTVDDEKIRCIMRLRFLCLLLWKEVADMMGPRYYDSQIRVIICEWLKKQATNCSP